MKTGALSFLGILSCVALFSLSACGSTGGNNCEGALSDCNGTCVNPQNDSDNCGACGNVCGAGTMCAAGECVSVCPVNQVECGGNCVDPNDNVNYCGATGDCLGPNAGESCSAGYSCTDGTCACEAPYFECAADTCVNLDTDVNNCGACYNQCAVGASCVASVCRAAVTYAGALPVTNGRWLYGNTVGLEGANTTCDANWAGSRVCTGEELVYAASNNELVNAQDINGNTVGTYWYEDQNAVDGEQCVDNTQENIRWTYQTAHIGVMGQYVALDNAAGTLGPVTVGACNTGIYNVGCCYEAIVIQ